jgi:maltose alpha-D-glucosyltransferase/alpha-amylase
VANLSRFPQPVELDLAEFKDTVPIELFGRTEFPPVSEEPYFLTLSPHSAFWFSLERSLAPGHELASVLRQSPRTVAVSGDWDQIVQDRQRHKIEGVLPEYLQTCRWFGGKSRELKSVHIREAVPFPMNSERALIATITVDYAHGETEDYLLPVGFAEGERAADMQQQFPQAVIARLELVDQRQQGILYEATCNPEFARALLRAISHNQSFEGKQGAVLGTKFRPQLADLALEPSSAKTEQSNSSFIFGDQFILKLFRRLEPGTNPELEVGRFLTEKNFSNAPQVAGALEYVYKNKESFTVGALTSLVPNSQDAWTYTLDSLTRFFDRVQSLGEESAQVLGTTPLLAFGELEPPPAVSTILGVYLESARLLGQRTAEMHLMLASDRENKDFAPEPFTPFYQRSLYQSMRNLVSQNLEVLRKRTATLDAAERSQARLVCEAQPEIIQRLRAIHQTPMKAMRIRCHGDYHLGQVLYTGKDFIIIDFEGEPTRSIGERRIKRSPLRDVAGMIRSFHYASHAALLQQLELGIMQPETLAKLQPWSRFWYGWISAAFLTAYHQLIKRTDLLPRFNEDLSLLLYAHLLEKAVYELGYELNHRPNWLKIPLEGVVQLLEFRKA